MQRLAVYVLLALTNVGLLDVDAARAFSRHKHRGGHRGGANPMRKVITMLQMMEKRIREEKDAREKLYDKYMCYCKGGTKNLETSIAAAEEKMPQLESQLKEADSMKTQLEEDLKQHKADRDEAERAITDANGLKESQAQAMGSEITQLKENIAALERAISVLSKAKGGGAEGFLQVSAAQELQRLSVAVDMSGSDREVLSAYLTRKQPVPDSNEVIGILKQMLDTMKEELGNVSGSLADSNANQESLVVAKTAELGASQAGLEDKTRRKGEVAVKIVALKNDLKDTKEGLEEDQKFLIDLKDSCKAKKQEWSDYQKEQSKEEIALADTIKMLSDDDALDLFKKAIPPAPSLLQVEDSQGDSGEDSSNSLDDDDDDSSEETTRQSALIELGPASRKDKRVALIESAVRGQKEGFDHLIAKIDDLRKLLDEEQKDDDNKKNYCTTEIDKAEDELKDSKRSVADKTTVIDDLKDNLEEVNRSIAALQQSIKELDKQVADATKTRKEENKASVNTLAETSTAKSLIEMARKRLHQYYGDDGKSLVQEGRQSPALSARVGEAPSANLEYDKKTAESGGVVAMMNIIRRDLIEKITMLETEEKRAQSDYEKFIQDSNDKRSLNSKAIADKEKHKAALEASLFEEKENLESFEEEARADLKELGSLHGECDWLLANFDLRQQARADEADALGKAKAVLSGADYS